MTNLFVAVAGSDSAPPPSESAQPAPKAQGTQGTQVKTQREYNIPPGESVTTTTTNTGSGFPDLIPTLIPALQSSSYVLVILTAFVAWSSRKLFTDFLDRHLDLMASVKDSLESEKNNNEKQLAVMQQLTENNKNLTSTVDKLAEKSGSRENS